MLLPFMTYKRLGNRGERLVNCFAETGKPSEPQPVRLFGSPGIFDWSTVPLACCRGAGSHKGEAYAVYSSTLYKIDKDGVDTAIGTIPGPGRVSMASNGVQLCVVANGDGYIWDGAILQPIGDPGFTSYSPDMVTEMDGFFLFNDANSAIWFKSKLYDGLNYEGDEFDLASKYSDFTVGILACEMLVLVACTGSIEFWYNGGGTPFPYQRAPNGVAEIGVAATHSLAKDETGTYFLASDNTVRLVQVGSIEPVRISHHGVEDAISGYTTIDDAWAFTTSIDGHNMYHLVFPTEGACWVFDSAAKTWHERESLNKDYWDVGGAVTAYGKELVFSRDSNKVGYLDQKTYTEWDYELLRSWTYANVYAQGKRGMHAELDVAIDTGWATGTTDPQIMLELSDDGGETFRGPVKVTFWKKGEYGRRAVFHRLGSSRNRVYRMSISDDAKMIVRDTQLRASQATLPVRAA